MRSILFVTTVLAIALSTAAMADDRDRRRSDRYDDHYQDRYNDRYDDRDRGGYRNNRVDVIAREIAETAAAMHREYERNNRRPDRDEARVAATLHELHEEAYEFARSAGRYGRGRDHGLDGLLQAFDQVASSLDRINRRPYVDRGMDRIWTLMSELDRSYGGRSDRYGRGRGWRDHGYRDRYRH